MPTEKVCWQDGDFESPDTTNRINLNFTFNVYLKGQSIIYSAAQPLWVSHPGKISYATIPPVEPIETADTEPVMDIFSVQASPVLEAGETYHANALIANPTIVELRAAGEEYPAWITDRYLQVPNNFSARIQALAFEITADYDNPYDKAVAITGIGMITPLGVNTRECWINLLEGKSGIRRWP